MYQLSFHKITDYVQFIIFFYVSQSGTANLLQKNSA